MGERREQKPMFNIVENFLRTVLAILLLVVGVVGLWLAIAHYVRTRNKAQSVWMLIGAILFMVISGFVF